jgi:hypothetical protein
MAINFSACSSRECHITGYDVVIEDGPDAGNEIQAAIVDPCNTLHDKCRAKSILMKALSDWLDANGTAAEQDIYASCCYAGGACGSKGGPDMTYYPGTQVLVLVTTATAPVSPETGNVPLPLDCDTVVVFA